MILRFKNIAVDLTKLSWFDVANRTIHGTFNEVVSDGLTLSAEEAEQFVWFLKNAGLPFNILDVEDLYSRREEIEAEQERRKVALSQPAPSEDQLTEIEALKAAMNAPNEETLRKAREILRKRKVTPITGGN